MADESTASPSPPPSFIARLLLAWVVFFQIIFDGLFAAKVVAIREGRQLPPAAPDEPAAKPKPQAPAVTTAAPEAGPSHASALQLLALFQREGRLVDFLQEDVASFSDADIGAAARVVHQGCRKALRDHAKLESVRSEEEGARVTVQKVGSEVKLTGNVAGEPPFTGAIRHRGWRVAELTLPESMPGHDARIVAPAEVEL